VVSVRIKKTETTNALEFLKYAEIYPISKVKRHLPLLYEGFIYVLGLERDGQPMSFIVVERRDDLHHVCSTKYFHEETGRREYEGLMLEKAMVQSKAGRIP